jgi:hypothetical protein
MGLLEFDMGLHLDLFDVPHIHPKAKLEMD